MKALIAALLVSVSCNSHGAQVPDKTSDAQKAGYWNVGVSVRADEAGNPILRVSFETTLRCLDPTANLCTTVSKGGETSPQVSGKESSPAVSPSNSVAPEDAKVRLFRSDGSKISIVAQSPKALEIGWHGDVSWAAIFSVTGTDIAAVDSAEVDYAGARLVFKFHEVVPRETPTQN